MAAYGALVSVMYVIEQIQHHPQPPISLDEIQVESLTENIAFLQDFLERYPHDGSKRADDLESRIADAAHAAEDAIESHIVDQISESTSNGEDIGSMDLYQGLQQVIEDMGFIKKEVMDFKEKRGVENQLINRNPTPSTGSVLRSPSTGQNTMVGFDDLLYEIMDKLTGGQLDRRVIPIYGMGGIGKTTLARNIFIHETVGQHFHILGWATISQEYSMKEILLQIISQDNKEGNHLNQKSEYGQLEEILLGEILHKRLSGRRYLIVMDDMWVIDVWDKINLFFPDNNNGSRILITTRLTNVAFQLTKTQGLEMNFLNEYQSWNLLCRNVFGEESCPLELEETGRMIAENCRGLPLSIVVIGRVLAKSSRTQEYWRYIAENLSSIVNLDDNEHCLKILTMSYSQLPVHLKPCFLYMGVFSEDSAIHVSSLIKLWVAEGFLKPMIGKTLEAVAEECLKDLIERNLIFVREWGSNGKIKVCSIHDLLRDLCLRQAQREKFLCVASESNPHILQDISTRRRIAIHRRASHRPLQPQSMSLIRSLICDSFVDLPLLDFRLLRVLNELGTFSYLSQARFIHPMEVMFSQLTNSRYLVIAVDNFWARNSQLIPSSLNLLWNLHTLIFTNNVDFVAPSEIWMMPQLRHIQFPSLKLPCPSSGHIDGRDDFVLGNLQTLMKIRNFRCCEGVVKRAPHMKKLQVRYDGIEGWSLSCFNNLGRLELESLGCSFLAGDVANWSDPLRNLTFPHSLRKLTLEGCRLQWEDVTTKIGSLPLLEVLKLQHESTKGHSWETVEEKFPRLKFLKIASSEDDLERWMTDNTHFPILERLVLVGLERLEKIPSELGNVSTLKLIELVYCGDSVVLSAKEILDEQEELGNVELQVRVRFKWRNEQVEGFRSHNFQVEINCGH